MYQAYYLYSFTAISVMCLYGKNSTLCFISCHLYANSRNFMKFASLMQTTISTNLKIFLNKILSRFWEIAVFVAWYFLQHFCVVFLFLFSRTLQNPWIYGPRVRKHVVVSARMNSISTWHKFYCHGGGHPEADHRKRSISQKGRSKLTGGRLSRKSSPMN